MKEAGFIWRAALHGQFDGDHTAHGLLLTHCQGRMKYYLGLCREMEEMRESDL